MDNGDPRFPYPRFLRVPFIFVPHGAPPPLEWMAEHPGWVKFPATFVPRAPLPEPERPPPEPEAETPPEPEPALSESPARPAQRDHRRVVPPPLFEGDPRLSRPRPERLRKIVPPPVPMLPPPPDTRPEWLRKIVPPPEPRPAPVRPPDFRAADALHEAQRKGMDLAMRLSTPEGRSAVIREALGPLHGQPKRSGMAVLTAWAEANGIGAKLPDTGAATVAAARAGSPPGPQPAPKPAQGGQAAVVGSIAASGVEMLPAAVEGAGVVTVGIAAAAAAILLAPETANPGEEKALRQALAEHGGKPEALWFEPPPPSPPLPGLVPPSLPKTKPGEGGFTPAVPGRHPEGFTPAPPPVLVHPGRPAMENKPTILESRKGRSPSQANSELANVLMPDGKPVGWINPGAGADIRTVSTDQFTKLKADLLRNAQPVPKPSRYDGYNGETYTLPNGEVFGIRISKRYGETIDVLHSGQSAKLPDGFKVHKK